MLAAICAARVPGAGERGSVAATPTADRPLGEEAAEALSLADDPAGDRLLPEPPARGEDFEVSAAQTVVECEVGDRRTAAAPPEPER